MKIIITSIIVLFAFIISTCNDKQVTQNNDYEKILTIKYIWLSQLGYELLNIDSIEVNYQRIIKKKGDTIFETKIDSNFNITSEKWIIIVSSFNMDSVMSLDSLYKPYSGSEEAIIELQIKSNERVKQVKYYHGNTKKITDLLKIDSLNTILYKMLEEIWKKE